MILIKIFIALLLLLAVPYMIGLLPKAFLTTIDYAPSDILILGYLFMLAVLELVGIPIVLFGGSYRLFVVIFAIILFLLSILGVMIGRKGEKEHTPFKLCQKSISRFMSFSFEEKLLLVILLGVVIFQLAMLFVYASMDADDFYYNAQALSAQQYNVMYRIDANTGRSTFLDVRHAMALFPMWEAFVSSLSGIHVAVFVHKLLPFVLIPMSYLLCYRISFFLFEGKTRNMLAFTLFMNIWRIFGFVSYYTTETFFLLRTWQGKSLAGNFIIPFIIYLFFMIESKGEDMEVKYYLLLALCVLAAGCSSSLAVMLVCGLIMLLSILFLIKNKNVRAFVYQLLCTVPGILYILIYIFAA